ncbi:hypothetical protein GWI33_003456 [Rhynchophorus ferrugineus]|uniref:Uncharacterized protein n=1 Tax=Rhynchophorus ferrugineus TaxID=354439 RepID=A0A834MKV4_RHYFE|nr:hypothetical protein GWI33_003456 [Rhynchophorus ferrugineus]
MFRCKIPPGACGLFGQYHSAMVSRVVGLSCGRSVTQLIPASSGRGLNGRDAPPYRDVVVVAAEGVTRRCAILSAG